MKSLKNNKSKGFFSNLKMPHAFTMLFFIIVFVGILSLIMSYADVTFVQDGTTKSIIGAGILDWIQAIPAGFISAIWVILFLFVLGGFINVVIKTQSLEALIGKVATKFHSDYKIIPKDLLKTSPLSYYWNVFKEGFRQTWIVFPIMLFFSFAGTTYGMAEESLAFYAIIIPLALAAGFDVYTGFLIIFAGAGVGVMGSTINPFSILAAVDASNPEAGSKIVTSVDGAAWRWIGWFVFTMATIIFVMWYAARVKKDKNNSALKDLFEVHEKTFRAASTGLTAPVLTRKRMVTCFLFLFTFVFMVFAMLNYDSMSSSLKEKQPMSTFEKDTFYNKDSSTWFHNQAITDKYDSAEYFGDYNFDLIFGNWYFGALIAYFFIASLVIAVINWKSEKNYITDMVDGAKDMMGVAFAVGIARAISVLLTVTNMKDYFVIHLSDTIANSKGNKNITVPLLSYVLFIPLTFLIPSTSGLANAAFPILAPAVNSSAPQALSGTITAYGWGAGLANMVVPTYGVVIGALALTKIPYGKFLKAIWKYLLMMFILGFVMIILGGAIGSSVF